VSFAEIRRRCNSPGFVIEKDGTHNRSKIATYPASIISEDCSNTLDIGRAGIAGHQRPDEPRRHERADVRLIEEDVDGTVEVLLDRLVGGDRAPGHLPLRARVVLQLERQEDALGERVPAEQGAELARGSVVLRQVDRLAEVA